MRKSKQEYEQSRRNKKQVKIRLSDNDYKVIKYKAEKTQLTINSYAKRMMLDGFIVMQELENIDEVAIQVSRVGNNINQIAKKLNSTSYIFEEDVKEIKVQLQHIYDLVEKLYM